MNNIAVPCPDCGRMFIPDEKTKHHLEIINFFTPKTLKVLVGTPAKLSGGFDLCVSIKDGVKFKGKEVDSLTVESIGACKYTDIIAPLIVRQMKGYHYPKK